MMIKTDYTREELIKLCETTIKNISNWDLNFSLTDNLLKGESWALLKAGCPFKIITQSDYTPEELAADEDITYTEENLLVIQITVPEGEKREYYFDIRKA
jgi:hypothetical protein